MSEEVGPIQNCSRPPWHAPDWAKLSFHCPKRWEDLNETGDAGRRFCSACEENVHLVRSKEELIAAAELKHCVAIKTDHFITAGMPRLPEELIEELEDDEEELVDDPGQKTAEDCTAQERFQIAQDWAEFDVQNPTSLNEIRDVSVLPHPKELILDCIAKEITEEQDSQMAMAMTMSATNLSLYQEGIGSSPVRAFGMSTEEMKEFRNLSSDEYSSEKGSRLLEKLSDKDLNERWQKYFKLSRDELTVIQDRMFEAFTQRQTNMSLSEDEGSAVMKLIFSTAAVGDGKISEEKISLLSKKLTNKGVSKEAFEEEFRGVLGGNVAYKELKAAIESLNDADDLVRKFTFTTCCEIANLSGEINRAEMGILNLMQNEWKVIEED